MIKEPDSIPALTDSIQDFCHSPFEKADDADADSGILLLPQMKSPGEE
jgi:hypothetical protein